MLLPFIITFLFSKKNLEKRLFWFMSQLNIHYAKNPFNYEVIEKSYRIFKGGPCPGYRAPNAPANSSNLFKLVSHKPFNILYFETKKEQTDKHIEKINVFIKNNRDWMQVHVFVFVYSS